MKEVSPVDVLIAAVVFFLLILLCLFTKITLIPALAAGSLCFLAVGLHRHYRLNTLCQMAVRGGKSAVVVLRVFVLIGILTALWRASGTIAYFVFIGVRLITPRSFILIAFLLPALLSLALGSSFGTAGTVGVILMTIARSGEANLPVTAGAVLSGVFLGERLSPASSSAALTAAVSEVGQAELQQRMWKNSIVPLILCLGFYGGLSPALPLLSVETHILQALEEEYRFGWPAALPAIVLLLCAALKIGAAKSIAFSCLTAGITAVWFQGYSFKEILRSSIFGYTPQHEELANILSGGGLLSMASVAVIVYLSCVNCGIMTETNMLDAVNTKIGKLVDRIGLFPTHILISSCCCGMFCNQAVGIVMSANLMKALYKTKHLSNLSMAANVGDSAINISALIPWSVICSVTLTAIGGDLNALPFALYLYSVPLCRCLSDRTWSTGRFSHISE